MDCAVEIYRINTVHHLSDTKGSLIYSGCLVCGIDFGVLYGEEFSGKIAVHHRKPLYEIKEDYVVDPIKDLVPVCPNCHAMLHKKEPPYKVEELKEIINK